MKLKFSKKRGSSLSRKPIHVTLAAITALIAFQASGSAQTSTAPAPDASQTQASTAPKASAIPAQKTKSVTEAPSSSGASVTLNTVVVKGDALTPSDIARHDLNQVDGGVALVRSADLEKGRLSTVADALAFQPGVYAVSVNGGEATRLSIRGSGIVRPGFLFGFGNQLEIDGLRLYSASGNPYEAIEPLVADHIEIKRGANAFDDGPLSLGGSINYVTKTGYDAAPAELRLEAGSYGYFHEQVSSGLVDGPADYYVSYTRFDLDGYRYNSQNQSNRFVGNFGYQITPDLSTRFNLRYAHQNQNDVGYLTYAQYQANPHQSQYGNIIVARINPGSWLGSNVTTWKIDPDSSLSAGFQYNNYPINNPSGLATGSTARFLFDDISSYLRYKRADTLFGHKSNTELSFIGYHQLSAEFDTWNNATGRENSRRPADLSDWSLVASNDTELAQNLWLTTGVAGTYQTRETTVAYSTGTLPSGSRISRHYTNVDPRVGLRYEFRPNDQVYANLSRSVDTPTPNSYVRTDGVFSPLGLIDLKPAQATTAEIGTRGQEGIFQWDVDYYYSWINDELLTTPVVVGQTPTITSNATPTFHQGVEASFNTTLWQENVVEDESPRHSDDPKDVKDLGSAVSSTSAPQKLILRQVYTWNDFHYVDDPVFGHNSLPAVPVNIYQAEVQYQHPSGFYAGVNVKTSLTKYAIDYANSFYVQPYALLGARVGYEDPKKHWEVFFQADNLTDENYVAAVNPTFNAGGNGNGAYFAPGVGRTFYGGASYSF